MTFLECLAVRGVPYRRKASSPVEIRLCCPFCADYHETVDTRFRLSLNISTGEAHCYNCDWKWNGKNTLAKVLARLGIAAVEVATEDAADVDINTPRPSLPVDFQPLNDKVATHDRFARRAYQYLLRRGVTLRQMRRNRIGFSMVGRYAYRIVFPVLVRGKLEGVVARDFTNLSKVRYLNSVGEKSLYNLQVSDTHAVLSEGIFKALTLERVLCCSSLALLGHAITDKQMQQLQDFGVRDIVLWPDPDVPGIAGVLDVGAKLLDAGFSVQVIYPPPTTQADETSDSDLRKLWARRICLDWRASMLLRAYLA